MNPTVTSKPKIKFSSRNLSAVYKAPLGTKPLPDTSIGPLQRPTSHMLVLGRAAVAPPAPLNTPSLKSESQLHDMHVSLVPASSNWAENTEKHLESEVPEHSPDVAAAAAPTAVSEKVWTTENVAEHLHTSSITARPKITVKNSGRWGDDAVEDDIVQNNIRRQIQKEKEFPDLREALEEMQTCHGQSRAAGEMQAVDPMHEPEQRHGRATGRWAHFNKEEMHCSMQDTGSRWSHGQYGHDEDTRWSRGRLRYDAGYGRESRRYETKRNAGSPDAIDCHARFSRSDVRCDIVASGDGDSVLNCSAHRIDWGSAPLSHRGASLPSAASIEGSRVHVLQPHRSSSPPLAPAFGSIAVDLACGRSDHGSDRARGNRHQTSIEWSENEESSTLVAEETQSSTESLSNSPSNSNSSPLQQVQLLKRPKMLFDPKTGGVFNAEDMTRPDKRHTSRRSGGKARNAANTSKSLGSTSASKRTDCKLEAQAKTPTSKSKSMRVGRKEANLTAGVVNADSSASQMVVVAIEQESVVKDTACTSETSSATSLNVGELTASQADIKAASKGSRVNRHGKRVTAKQSLRQESKSRVTKTPRDTRPSTSLSTRPKQQHRNAHHDTTVDVRRSTTLSSDKAADRMKRNISTRYDRPGAGSNKPAQRGIDVQEGDTQKSKMDLAEIALLTQIAGGSNGGVVVLTEEQQGIEVSPEDDGFETIKSRRAVLFEKKQLREQVMATVAVSPVLDEKRECASLEKHGDVQSKGVQENLGMAAKVFKAAIESASRPRGKATNSRKNSVEVIEGKKSKRSSKQGTRKLGSRKEIPVKAKIPVSASHTELPEQVGLMPIEQVVGEALPDCQVLKKSVTVTEVSVKPRKDRQSDQARGNSTHNVNDQKPSAGTTRKQEQNKRQGPKRSARSGVRSEDSAATKPRAPGGTTAKARPKQVRQVYVVKTLASAPATTV